MPGSYGAPQTSALPNQDGGTVPLRSGKRRQNLRLKVDVGLKIEGTVTDEAGAAVPFASVGLFAPDNHSSSRSTRTDALGQFVLPRSPEGAYHVSAEEEGVGRDRKLNVSAGQSVDLMLSLTREFESVAPETITTVRPLP